MSEDAQDFTLLETFAAWICRLATVMTGGLIDPDGLNREVNELERLRRETAECEQEIDALIDGNNAVRQQIAELAGWMQAALVPPKRFEAYTDCPKCGRLDYHLLRSPKPPPCDEEMRAWEGRRTTAEIHQWGNGVIRTVDTSSPPPVDESPFEVIRICQCGHEWGQL